MRVFLFVKGAPQPRGHLYANKCLKELEIMAGLHCFGKEKALAEPRHMELYCDTSFSWY
jgi:hypothetical protein